MEPTELPGELYERIIAELSPPDGQAVSSAHLVDAVDGDHADVSEAIEGLLRFGVLEFVNTSGSNMHVRVRLHQPTETETTTHEQMSLTDLVSDTLWLAYIVDGNDPRRRRARRLFEEREAAETHLEQIASVDDFTPVPGIKNVLTAYLGDWDNEFAVLREEPIFDSADSPWQ